MYTKHLNHTKMKYLFIVLSNFVLTTSCQTNDDKTDTIEFQILESRLQEQKNNLEARYMLNPEKYFPKYQVVKEMNDSYMPIINKIKENRKDFNRNDLTNSITQLNKIQKKYLNQHQYNNIITKNFISSNGKFSNNFKVPILRIVNLLLSDQIYFLDQFIYETGKNDKVFNYYEPVIKENSNTIKLGQVYRAEIYVAAFDTTTNPTITIKKDSIPIISGKGIYQVKTHKTGRFEYEGTIKMITSNGQFIKIPFKKNFNVIK